MTVLDLRGPEFLAFFAVSFAAAAVVSAIARRFRGASIAPTQRELEGLHPYELAYLSGGPGRASEAALAALVQQGTLSIDNPRTIISITAPAFVVGTDSAYRGAPVEQSRHFLENALLRHARANTVSARDLRDAGLPATLPLRDALRNRDLVLSSRYDAALWVLTKGTFWALMGLGLAKMVVGASRGKPVVLLFVLLGVAFLLERWIPRHSFRTRRGDKALEAMRAANEALRATTAADIEQLTPSEAALALGLFSPAAMAGTVGAGLLASVVLPPRLPSWWSSNSSDWDGTTCGASCGGGGGGGCGGGCGGCGGD